MSVDFSAIINNFLTAELGEDVRGSLVEIAEALQAAINSQINTVTTDLTDADPNAAAQAKTVGDFFDKTLLYRGTLTRTSQGEAHTAENDLNLVLSNGVYRISGNQSETVLNPYNSPNNLTGVLIVAGEESATTTQVVIDYVGRFFTRYKRANEWLDWKQLAEADTAMLYRGTLTRSSDSEQHTSGNDLDLVVLNGVYYLSGSTSETVLNPFNAPSNLAGILAVFSHDPSYGVGQIVIDYSGNTYTRYKRFSEWTDWSRLLTESDLDGVVRYLGILTRESDEDPHTETTDLDMVLTSGIYYVSGNISETIRTPYNAPNGRVGILTVDARSSVSASQTFVDYAGATHIRYKRTGGWLDWREVAYTDRVAPLASPFSAKVLQRVGCIGDSYTSGYILIDEDEPPGYGTHEAYAWPAFMETLTGHTWTNFGRSGSSTKSWMTGSARLDEVQAAGNKCQAYVIGLLINDSGDGLNRVAVGQPGDIGTDADSYYAYYYKLIQAVSAVNEDAPIFCLTCPKPEARYTPYNVAMREIVSQAKGNGYKAYLVDLEQDYYNAAYFTNPVFVADAENGHYSSIGYEFMAECLLRILSDVINENLHEFQTIHRVPFDPVVVQEA